MVTSYNPTTTTTKDPHNRVMLNETEIGTDYNYYQSNNVSTTVSRPMTSTKNNNYISGTDTNSLNTTTLTPIGGDYSTLLSNVASYKKRRGH